MAALITTNQLQFSFPGSPTPVFDQLEITINRGEFVSLVGGSGVGKSTLLRCLMGLIKTQPESITYHSASGKPLRPAMLFQDARLLPWLTVAENIQFGLKPLELTQKQQDQAIVESLQLAQIDNLADRWAHQLSGGQTQRVGLARALAINPDILFMDEPFSSVDALTRRSLQDALLQICAQTNSTVFFVTHDIAEATYLSDRVIVLAGNPATVTKQYSIEQSHPRNLADPELIELNRQITANLNKT